MHNDYVREDGQWPPETVPTARDYALFDEAQSKGLRLKQTTAPATPVIIGQAGLRFTGHDHSVEGGVRTESGGRLVLGDDDYPMMPTTRGRQLMVLLGLGLRASYLDQEHTHELSMDPVGVRMTTVQTNALQFPIPAELLHDGATLSQVVLRFRVGQPHFGVPGFLPRFTIRRVAVGHETVDYLAAGGGVSSGGGATLSPAPTTAAAYYADGAVQAITLTCTANNVLDVGAYSYVLELQDEQSSDAAPGNIFHSIVLSFSGITSARAE